MSKLYFHVRVYSNDLMSPKRQQQLLYEHHQQRKIIAWPKFTKLHCIYSLLVSISISLKLQRRRRWRWLRISSFFSLYWENFIKDSIINAEHLPITCFQYQPLMRPSCSLKCLPHLVKMFQSFFCKRKSACFFFWFHQINHHLTDRNQKNIGNLTYLNDEEWRDIGENFFFFKEFIHIKKMLLYNECEHLSS